MYSIIFFTEAIITKTNSNQADVQKVIERWLITAIFKLKRSELTRAST